MNYLECSVCGERLTEAQATLFDDKILCEHCLDEETTICDCCMERIWTSRARGDGYTTLCSSCYANNYATCTHCGILVHNENVCYDDDTDAPYCEACFEKVKSLPIKSYNYKPEPIFYGSGNLFMGVELEVDRGGEDNKNAEELLDIANESKEHIYCKHDGSLDEGFEIVSHPMTLDYHKNSMNWKEVFTKAIRLGYSSHNTCSCGLHIHCGRNDLGETVKDQDEVIGRLIFFFEKHWNELVRFSRRSYSNLNRWAARYEAISCSPQETYKKAKDKHMGRYVAVNLMNDSTVEFRIFRGTLKYKTFIATLQLIDRICSFAINSTDTEIEETSWSDFVMSIDREEYPELVEYLKLKRLYVNDLDNDNTDMEE